MTMATKTAETTRAGQAFEEFLDGQLADPVFRAGFERKLAKVKSIADVLRVIEEVRERENIPKAEIARRMDRRPEAISRLLRGEGSNPTLDTLIDLVDAVGLELDIRIKRQPAKRNGGYSPLKIRAAV
jgi:DNA-binding phage protein